MPRASARDPSPSLDAIEATLHDLIPRLLPDPVAARGRPPILPAALLWSALLVTILRTGAASQAALWRLVASTGLWDYARVPVSVSAVYQRLRRDGPTVLERLFTDATTELLATTPPTPTIAPFATDVLVLDESTLDPVARLLPTDPPRPRKAGRRLPGTLTGLFDVRRQLWRTIQLRTDPRQNEKVVAPDLVATLAPGTLVLADLGYFSFPWFDALTVRGLWWVSRQRHKTSVVVKHVLLDQPDQPVAPIRLVWLGKYRPNQAARLVRLVEYQTGDGRWHCYLTNVLDPALLSLEAVTMLYGRRWDIELAIKLVKRELGLHLLWSTRWETIQTQIWGVLLIAQIAMGLRRQVAEAAGVDDFDVSLPLLLGDLPRLVRSGVMGTDVIGWLVAEGPRLGYIRPSRRIVRTVPAAGQPWEPPPPDLETIRPAKAAGRKCGPNRTNRRPIP